MTVGHLAAAVSTEVLKREMTGHQVPTEELPMAEAGTKLAVSSETPRRDHQSDGTALEPSVQQTHESTLI